jgi:hypothetical protein
MNFYQPGLMSKIDDALKGNEYLSAPEIIKLAKRNQLPETAVLALWARDFIYLESPMDRNKSTLSPETLRIVHTGLIDIIKFCWLNDKFKDECGIDYHYDACLGLLHKDGAEKTEATLIQEIQAIQPSNLAAENAIASLLTALDVILYRARQLQPTTLAFLSKLQQQNPYLSSLIQEALNEIWEDIREVDQQTPFIAAQNQ